MSKYLSRTSIQVAIILIATVLAYINILGNNFVWDDTGFIKQWELPRQITNLPKFFDGSAPIGFEGVYRPIKIVILSLNLQIFGNNNALMFHLQGIIIHCLITVLTYFIVKKITGSQYLPFFVSLLFGISAVHVESVSFATASLDLYGILFIFISYWLFLKYKNSNKSKLFWSSVAFAILGYFSNELNLSFFLLIVLSDYFLFKNRVSKYSKQLIYLAYFLPTLVYFIVRFFILDIVSRKPFVLDQLIPTLLIMGKVVVYYFLALLSPFSLNIIPNIGKYPGLWGNKELIAGQSFFDPLSLLGFSLVILSVLFFLILRNKQSLISFSIGWILITFLPFTNIFPVGIYYSERYLYLLSFGFYLLLGILFAYLLSLFPKQIIKRDLIRIVLASIFLIFFALTFNRTFVWRNDLALFTDTASKSTNNSDVINNLGISYVSAGKVDKAILVFQRAVSLNPKNGNYYENLGNAYYAKGDLDKALKFWQKANQLDPKNEFFATKLIQHYYEQKQYEKALVLLNTVNFKEYRYLKHYFLGKIYLAKNDLKLAKIELDHSMDFKEYAPAFVGLAEIYLKQKEYTLAEEMVNKALGRTKNVGAYSVLAKIYIDQGKFDLALASIDKALALDPEDLESIEIKNSIQGYFQDNLLQFLQKYP